jgi:hypothetical protein
MKQNLKDNLQFILGILLIIISLWLFLDLMLAPLFYSKSEHLRGYVKEGSAFTYLPFLGGLSAIAGALLLRGK